MNYHPKRAPAHRPLAHAVGASPEELADLLAAFLAAFLAGWLFESQSELRLNERENGMYMKRNKANAIYKRFASLIIGGNEPGE